MLELWYQALHAERGIEIACSDVDAVRKALYKLRRDVKDTDLSNIAISLSPFDPNRLWMVKKNAKA